MIALTPFLFLSIIEPSGLEKTTHWRDRKITLRSVKTDIDSYKITFTLSDKDHRESRVILKDVSPILGMYVLKNKYLDILIKGCRNLWWFRLGPDLRPILKSSPWGGDSEIIVATTNKTVILCSSSDPRLSGYYTFDRKLNGWRKRSK